MWELVKHGLGIGVPDGNIGDAEPLVRPALPELGPFMFPIWLVAHREVNTRDDPRGIRSAGQELRRA